MRERLVLLLPFIGVAIIFVIFAWIVFGVFWVGGSELMARGGSLGESFGILSALFSGLGFAGIVLALYYQQKQLSAQHEELGHARREASAEYLSVELQRFEDAFFALLRFLRDNLDSLYSKSASGEPPLRGVELLAARLREMRKALQGLDSGEFPTSEEGRVLFVWALWKGVASSLGRQARYVETVATVVTWISERCPPTIDASPYWRMLAAQLTIYESSYLFYQVIFSPSDHPLRRSCDTQNSFYASLFRAAAKNSHMRAACWICNQPEPGQAAQFVLPFTRKQIKAARRVAGKKEGKGPEGVKQAASRDSPGI